jgi:WD40 repeat protein
MFADSENLITGSQDHIVRLWRVFRGNAGLNALNISLSNMMRVHRDIILCVAASRPWSVIVSGSKDGSAALWDLNRAVYMRSIWHGDPGAVGVHLVTINESTVRSFLFLALRSQRLYTLRRDTLRRVHDESCVYTRSTPGPSLSSTSTSQQRSRTYLLPSLLLPSTNGTIPA